MMEQDISPERKFNTIPIPATADQKLIIHQLRENFGSALRAEDDDAMLARFCRARQYDLKLTTIMLEDFLKWREEYKPEMIAFTSDMERYLKYQSIFFLPKHDRFGRSILIALPRNHNPYVRDLELGKRTFLWTINDVILKMVAPIENYVSIIDLDGYGTRNNDWVLLKDHADFLQKYYPERMGVTFIVNAPWYIQSIWKIVQRWLEERTKRKIQFLGKNFREVLLELIPEDTLPDFLGGKYVHPPQELNMWDEHSNGTNHVEEGNYAVAGSPFTTTRHDLPQ